mmetsp:Transcript_108492/g.315518  ORF Transcript_108492/g.315518 Transcript_108492/m.315518 type:complete len:202 (+) Transcript_108492:829-1434(+)
MVVCGPCVRRAEFKCSSCVYKYKGHDVQPHLARRNELDLVPEPPTNQHRVCQCQTLCHGHAHAVTELRGGRTSSSLGSVDCDKIRCDPRLDHSVAERREFFCLADTHFKSDGLAPRQLAQLLHELHQAYGIVESRVPWGRVTVLQRGILKATGFGDSFGDLAFWQHAAVRRLGALAELDLDHFTVLTGRVLRKLRTDEVVG